MLAPIRWALWTPRRLALVMAGILLVLFLWGGHHHAAAAKPQHPVPAMSTSPRPLP